MNPKKNIPKNIPPDPENPFRVPEGYFDDVRKRVLERIRAEAQSATGQVGHRFHEQAENVPLDGAENAPLDGAENAPLDGAENVPFDGAEKVPSDGAEKVSSDRAAKPPLGVAAKAPLGVAAKAPLSGAADAQLAGGKSPGRDPDGKEVTRRKKIYLQPYLTLAAAISGVALVVYIVLQAVTGSRSDEAYDIAMLDRAGVIQDESILAETYTGEDEASTYSEWDEQAIVYLASNEVDLLDLLDTN